MRVNEGRRRVAVCVCTFRRPAVLAELLARMGRVLERLPDHVEATLVVVDDDPDGSARTVVEEGSAPFDGRVAYVIVGSRNISTARNRALDEGSERADLLAIIDDDCLPNDDWLAELVRVQERFDADLVSGRCRDVAPDGAPSWYVEEPWLAEAPPVDEGAPLPHGPLKNSLVLAAAVRAHDLRFDEAFGVSGGEDALFMHQAAARGLDHRHAPGAVVDEVVPLERATLRYQLRRALWYGNADARTALAAGARPRWRIAVTSAKRLLGGVTHVLRRVLARRPTEWRWALATSLTGVGGLLGVVGVRVLHASVNRVRSR